MASNEFQPIYSVFLRAHPHVESLYFGKVDSVFFSYWVNTQDKEEAIKKAVSNAEGMGWAVLKVDGTKFVGRDYWIENPDALTQFDKAIQIGIACIISSCDPGAPENN
jgi:hypothetical protein